MCKQRASVYEWEEYTGTVHIFTERTTLGVINVHDAYDRAAREQAEGTYTKWDSRFECEECTVDGLARLIGRPHEAIADVIAGAKELANQDGVERSFVVFNSCTSYDDNGFNSVVSAPNTTIEEVARIVREYKAQ